MKHRKRILSVLLATAFLTVFTKRITFAETEDKESKPNVDTEEKQSLDSVDFHHESFKKRLTFQKDKYPFEEVKKQLFQGDKREKTTMTAKSSQLQLFSEASEQIFHMDKRQIESKEDSSSVTIFYVSFSVISLLLVLLFFNLKIIRKREERHSISNKR